MLSNAYVLYKIEDHEFIIKATVEQTHPADAYVKIIKVLEVYSPRYPIGGPLLLQGKMVLTLCCTSDFETAVNMLSSQLNYEITQLELMLDYLEQVCYNGSN